MCSTEKLIATVHAADDDDVDKAVKAAHKALRHESWKHLPPTDRGMLMLRLADLIEKKRELFATIDAWDNGTTPLPPICTYTHIDVAHIHTHIRMHICMS